jgi:DNA-binding NarL/FixJ family response regulator
MSREVRVLLADDDPLVRAGLSMMLDGKDGIVVAGKASDGDEVPAAVNAHTPDVVLMDIRMPNVDGITATQRVRARPDPPEVIVLTTFDTDDNILRALRAGATGFLVKDTPPAQIVEAIRRVADGDPILSPQVMRKLMERAAADADRQQRARQELSKLSDRERDIVTAVARSQSNADIARELFMSVATVKGHVSSIFTKLDLNNRTQIALLAHDADR